MTAGASNWGGSDGEGDNTVDAQAQNEISSNPNAYGSGTTLAVAGGTEDRKLSGRAERYG